MTSCEHHSRSDHPAFLLDRLASRVSRPALCVLLIAVALGLAVSFAHLFFFLLGEPVPYFVNTVTILTTLCTAFPLIMYCVRTICRLDCAMQDCHDQAEILDERNAALDEARIAAEAASASKSKFLASMSHDLRTPLNAIIGFSDMLCQQRALFGDFSEARVDEYGTAIHASGHHLLSLVNDLLDLARIECGDHEISPESVPIDTVTKDAVLPLMLQAEKRGQSIEVERIGSCAVIEVDLRAVRQILVNLLSNALRYSPDDAVVRLTVRGEVDGTVFEVIDEGIGMTPEETAIAVEPFTRMSDAHVASGESIGLGLSIVGALCARHGGSIEFESEKGRGTTVRVCIPTGDARTGIAA